MKRKILTVIWALAAVFVCHAAVASIIFCADCKAPNKRGQWSAIQQFAAGRITRVPDPSGSRGMVSRIEVRPGDNVGGWGGERAERAGMLGRLLAPLPVLSSTPKEYYGISVKLPGDWQGPDIDNVNGTWGIFLQLHGPDKYKAPPAMALTVDSKFHLNMYVGDISVFNKKVLTYELSNGAIKFDKWIDFIIEVEWSAYTDGSLVIYRRDEDDSAWNEVFRRAGIATLQYRGAEAVEAHYWKTGYYRSPSKSTSVLWLGPLMRSTTREEVEASVFGPN